jgi:hypothetical protein
MVAVRGVARYGRFWANSRNAARGRYGFTRHRGSLNDKHIRRIGAPQADRLSSTRPCLPGHRAVTTRSPGSGWRYCRPNSPRWGENATLRAVDERREDLRIFHSWHKGYTPSEFSRPALPHKCPLVRSMRMGAGGGSPSVRRRVRLPRTGVYAGFGVRSSLPRTLPYRPGRWRRSWAENWRFSAACGKLQGGPCLRQGFGRQMPAPTDAEGLAD